ncbi:MAG TPA: DNA-3-methyladenine glycosylase [Pirellulales bacterium]|nr:DNA-3-methyladenine glycosylase [Pirellulales bacterium]
MPSSRISLADARVLGPDFFARSALTVARELMGKFLVRRIGGETRAAIIHETEAYVGPHDLACHASRGRTARTEVMFGPAGYWYVYFIYGMHWMLNVVTSRHGHPAAVLVRGAGPWIGPARLTKALAIDRTLNGQPASPESGLWVEDRGYRVRRGAIRRTPRIGVDYSGEWAARPYRFVMGRPHDDELAALH